MERETSLAFLDRVDANSQGLDMAAEPKTSRRLATDRLPAVTWFVGIKGLRRGWVMLAVVLFFHLLLSAGVALVIPRLDMDGIDALICLYWGTLVAPATLVAVWIALACGSLSGRLVFASSLFVLTATIHCGIFPGPTEMSSFPLAIVVAQSVCVQVPLWPLRLFGGWRLSGSDSPDHLASHEVIAFRWIRFAAWIFGIAGSFGAGSWLIASAFAASEVAGKHILAVLAVASGANLLVVWLAMPAAFAKRDVLWWVAIAVVGAAIISMVENHLAVYPRDKETLVWCGNGSHLGWTLLTFWAIRLGGFCFH